MAADVARVSEPALRHLLFGSPARSAYRSRLPTAAASSNQNGSLDQMIYGAECNRKACTHPARPGLRGGASLRATEYPGAFAAGKLCRSESASRPRQMGFRKGVGQ